MAQWSICTSDPQEIRVVYGALDACSINVLLVDNAPSVEMEAPKAQSR